MRDKEEVRQELIKAGVGCMILEVFWPRKISLFAENLRATEHILGGVWRLFRKHWGRLIATKTRIVFLEQKGVFGSVVESFNYTKISALEMTKGLIFAEMTITSGVATQEVQWIPKFQLTRFVQLVQGMLDEPRGGLKIDARHETPHEEATVDIEPDVGLQLKRLNQLRLKGILTDDEFETQRTGCWIEGPDIASADPVGILGAELTGETLLFISPDGEDSIFKEEERLKLVGCTIDGWLVLKARDHLQEAIPFPLSIIEICSKT